MATHEQVRHFSALGSVGRGWVTWSAAIVQIGRGLSRSLGRLADHRAGASLPCAPATMSAAQRSRMIFMRALQEDSNLEMEWLWLATQVVTVAERRYALERALAINPHSEIARADLAKLPPRPDM